MAVLRRKERYNALQSLMNGKTAHKKTPCKKMLQFFAEIFGGI